MEKTKCEVCGKEINQVYPICDECDEQGYWIDPIGTVHAPDADPLRAYE